MKLIFKFSGRKKTKSDFFSVLMDAFFSGRHFWNLAKKISVFYFNISTSGDRRQHDSAVLKLTFFSFRGSNYFFAQSLFDYNQIICNLKAIRY